MQIIPVIDLKGGVVVRGVRGDRKNYRPIETPLASSATAVAVAEGLMRLAPFSTLYVADLDAIEGGAPNAEILDALEKAFPNVELWVDAGFRDGAMAAATSRNGTRVPVLGSETLSSAAALAALDRERTVLSLDFLGPNFLGDPAILSDARAWPDRVVVMTLARVGSGEGPDLQRLREICERACDRSVFAAGGMRSAEDIEALERSGAAGALVSSALHDGGISASQARRWTG